MEIQENIPLAPLTTLGVGGPARFFLEALDEATVRRGIEFANERKLPLFVLGGGSNLVVSDAGFPGLVLKIAIAGIETHENNGTVTFTAGAGEEWDKFVAFTVGKNCAGIECLSGIPGSVGGTPVQNVGAYGQEVSQTILSTQALNLQDLKLHEISREQCGFEYRTSRFNTSERGQWIILRVSYELTPNGAPGIRYADLQKHFAGWSMPPTLHETRQAVRHIRARKAMLIQPGDEDCKSAGSFFKNPVLSAEAYADVTKRASARGFEVPSYPALDAQRKVSAAWLVEHSGFSKGFAMGRASISRKHALALVNRGDATAADILALKDSIQQRVEEIWGIHLEPEPVMVGF